MIGELIQTLFSLIFTILRSLFTSRVLTVVFLFFLFLVSLGAAEEKQVRICVFSVLRIVKEWKGETIVELDFIYTICSKTSKGGSHYRFSGSLRYLIISIFHCIEKLILVPVYVV